MFTMVFPSQAVAYQGKSTVEDHSVMANYQYVDEPNVYNAFLSNNHFNIITKERTSIVVVPKEKSAQLQLIVRVITKESEAFSWFEHCFDKAEGDIYPLEIYYLDSASNRISLNDGDMIYVCKNGEKCNNVYSLSPEEKVISLNADTQTETVSFLANGERYYVPVFAHKYVATVIPPTIESMGYTIYTCPDCGYTYVGDFTPMLPVSIHYIVPCFNEIATTITMKSNRDAYNITATNGIFCVDEVRSAVYRVYAKQKNALTIYLGEYDTKYGEVINNENLVLPLGDVNADDVIDIADISVLLATGNYGSANDLIDLTEDGIISVDDIAVVLQAYCYGKKSVEII